MRAKSMLLLCMAWIVVAQAWCGARSVVVTGRIPASCCSFAVRLL